MKRRSMMLAGASCVAPLFLPRAALVALYPLPLTGADIFDLLAPVVCLSLSALLTHALLTTLIGDARRLRVIALTPLYLILFLSLFLSIASLVYWRTTGAILDGHTLSFFLSTLSENWRVFTSEMPAWLFVLATLACGVVPLGVFAGGLTAAQATRDKPLIVLFILLNGFMLHIYQQLLPLGDLPPALTSPPPLLIARTALDAHQGPRTASTASIARYQHDASMELDIKIKASPQIKKHIFIFTLESTGINSTSLDSDIKAIDLDTTPTLKELAKSGYNFSNIRAIIPHTSKSIASILCGNYPSFIQISPTIDPPNAHINCLPEILRTSQYKTSHFQTPIITFESRYRTTFEMGIRSTFHEDKVDKTKWDKLGYFGYDDKSMLKPIEEWIQDNKNNPLFMSILSVTAHHDYILPKNINIENITNNIEHNKYLTAIKYVDGVLSEFINILKRQNIYNNSIIIVIGDHGEAFGEHGFWAHDHAIYEEIMRVPLVIHVPGLGRAEVRATQASQESIAPTVLALAGFEVNNPHWTGKDLLKDPADQVTLHRCWFPNSCLGMITADRQKYIYHFDKKAPERFDLNADPLERNPLKPDPKMIEDLIKRHREVEDGQAALYNYHVAKNLSMRDEPPAVVLNKQISDAVKVRGYTLLNPDNNGPGDYLFFDVYYEITAPLTPYWYLYISDDAQTPLAPTRAEPFGGQAGVSVSQLKQGTVVKDRYSVKVPLGYARDRIGFYMALRHALKGSASARDAPPDLDGFYKIFDVAVRGGEPR